MGYLGAQNRITHTLKSRQVPPTSTLESLEDNKKNTDQSMEVQALLHSTVPTFIHRQLSFNRLSTTSTRLNTTWQLQALTQLNGSTDTTSTSSGPVPSHKVTVHDRQRGLTFHFTVPEDQYILHTAEDQDIRLPFACRHGCCTSCAVRVKSGELRQPEALGISAELKAQGYALLCVGFPLTDLEVETQDEDEVYWLQFGRYFARGPIERDDYALELALGDE